jgi:alpha-glucosidase (family GH31 glycosyl hydrolase)
LVAPVLNPGGYVNAYLPPGDWYDLWTGEKKQGARTYRMRVDLDHMPIYIRANAIIPTAKVSDSVPDMWDQLTFEIYPQSDGLFEIPEENGLAPTMMRVHGGGTMQVDASGPERTWDFVFRDVDEPGEVSIDLGGSNAESTWKYDARQRNLEVHVERCTSVGLKIVK